MTNKEDKYTDIFYKELIGKYVRYEDIHYRIVGVREISNEKFSCYYNNLDLDNFNWAVSAFRHTTKEEKQEFFDELKAKGLSWNAETKTMENIRKREEYGESYLYVNRLGEVCAIHELKSCFDDDNFNSGNYYSAEEIEQAEEDAKAVKAIFEKRLKI